jgi:DNA repair protein RadC
MPSSKDPKSESPKERLAKYGADSLSIQELLALLLFSGYSKDKAIKIVVNLLKPLMETLSICLQPQFTSLPK